MERETHNDATVSLWRESAAFNIVLLRSMNHAPAPVTPRSERGGIDVPTPTTPVSKRERSAWIFDPVNALRGRF